MKKVFTAICMLTLFSVLIAACAPTAATTPAAPVKETVVVQQTVAVKETVVVNQEITATPAPEKVAGTVRVGSWDSGDGLKPLNDAIAKFETKFPTVKVQLESVPQGYGDKLLTQFAAGTAPDVFQVGDGDAAKFASQGVLEPLDPYITGDNPLDMSVFFPAVADIGKVDGKTFLLTKDYSPLVLFYNKKLFDEAGVAYPTDKWTWDDFLAAAQKLTKTDAKGQITQWGVQLPDGWGDWIWLRGILPIIYQGGGDIVTADGKATGAMNSEATIAAVQWYVDLFTKHKVAPTKDDVAAFQGTDLFQTGKVAMLWTGRWPISTYEADSSLNFSTAQLPQGKARGNSICWAGFAMYAKSQNKDAAWAFLKFITAEEGAQEFAKYAFTAVKPIAELQGLATDPYNANIVKDLEFIKPLPEVQYAKYAECGDKYFVQELETVFLKNVTVKDALDLAAKEADECLAK
jgi:multiple sugar transport system substrate-binding protein